jgi:hypothetical protein
MRQCKWDGGPLSILPSSEPEAEVPFVLPPEAGSLAETGRADLRSTASRRRMAPQTAPRAPDEERAMAAQGLPQH